MERPPPALPSSLLLPDLNGFSVRQAASHCAVAESMGEKEGILSLAGYWFRPQSMFSELNWILWVQDKVPPDHLGTVKGLNFLPSFLGLGITQARRTILVSFDAGFPSREVV